MRNLIGSICLSGIMLYIASAQECVAPPAGMVAWWTGNSHTRDVVGGHNGFLVGGAGFTPGKVRQGFDLLGFPSHIDVPDHDAWNLSDRAFTIEFWVMWRTVRNSPLGLPDTIFIGNDESGGNLRKWFFARGGGVLNFHINGPEIGPIFFCQASFTPIAEQWYHLAITRQGSEYKVYSNGELLVTDYLDHVIPEAAAPLTIGQAEGLGFLDGVIDEMALYHRALSQQELVAIYLAGNKGKCLIMGDVNENGCIDDTDLLAILFAFGLEGDGLSEDVNEDGIVDDIDLLIVLFSFGTGC